MGITDILPASQSGSAVRCPLKRGNSTRPKSAPHQADRWIQVESLRRGTFEPLHTIVVDNASTDDSAALLSSTVPEVELIANAVNLGFAEGNNVGIRAALAHGADYVLILNNDTIVGPHAIEMLVAEAGRLGAGAVSPLIYFAEPDNLIWFAGADFDARRAYPGRVTG